MSNTLRIGLIQMVCDEHPDTNRQRAAGLVREAAGRGASIVCLPELFCSRYFCQSEDHRHFELAEPIPGPTTELFCTLARELGVVIIASLFERRARGLFHNTAVVIDADGSLLGAYRKMHIPDDPQYYEKFYFTPGDRGFRSFRTRFADIGVLVCWDQWFPEAARATSLTGAEILFYPTAIGWLPEDRETVGDRQLDAWRTVQRSHAIANGVFVAAVNRTGFEPAQASSDGIEFWGHSFVAAPDGRLVAEAGAAPTVLVTEIDRDEIDTFRTHWPFLRDRRVDAYGSLLRLWSDGD